jgi:putative membrane protein
MTGTYWNDWYSGWGWFLWFGIMILMFSSVGNWGYTYRVRRNYGRPLGKDAQDILSERYARGEITHEDYGRMKAAILA